MPQSLDAPQCTRTSLATPLKVRISGCEYRVYNVVHFVYIQNTPSHIIKHGNKDLLKRIIQVKG